MLKLIGGSLSFGIVCLCFLQQVVFADVTHETRIKTEMNFSKTRSRSSSSAEKTVASTAIPVHGMTFILNETFHFPKGLSCDQIFDGMEVAFNAEIFYGDALFSTSYMACITDTEGNPLELFVQAVGEPIDVEHIPQFMEYLFKTEGRMAGDKPIHFAPVKQVISRFDLQALFIHTPIVDESLITDVATTHIFHSLKEDYDYHAYIHDNFWNPLNQFLPFVDKELGKGTSDLLVAYSLPRSNALLANYDRTFVLPGDKPLKNYLLQVLPMRNCKDNPNQRCM